AEAGAVCADSRRKGKVHSRPALAAVRGRVASHRKPEDFVGAAGQRLRIQGVQRDECFTLRSTLVRDVYVRANLQRGRRSTARRRPLAREMLVFRPPGRVMWRAGLRLRERGNEQAQQPGDGQAKSILHSSLLTTREGNIDLLNSQ